jgi:hypothetical protein
MKLTDKQKELIKIYVRFVEEKLKYPTNVDMLVLGVSRNRVREHFGNLSNLKDAAREAYPNKFKKIDKKKAPHIHSDFTKEALGAIVKENDYQEGTFFVTGVSPVSYLDWTDEDYERATLGLDVLAQNLFMPGFQAMQNFLKRENAEMILLPMPAHVKALQKQPLYYDPRLKPFKNKFATQFTFNRHLKAIEAHINPQQFNPLTGFKRLRVHKYTDNYQPGQEIKMKKTSLIIGHSKQMMEIVPTGNDTHPRMIHSTGTITNPRYLPNRVGMIANEDHKLGGLIIEIRDGSFWTRQVQFDPKNGSFVDLGKRYHADGSVTEERAEAFKMGDVHPGLHDDEALNAMYELWDVIKPKRIFFEDFFDGTSISHHTEKKRLTRALQPEHFKDLPTEIEAARRTLQKIWDRAPADAELIATASNHPDHVMQYLDRGAYVNDCKANYEVGHRMVVHTLDGKNPLKEYLDPEGRMRWTGENEDYFVEGCQMNAHGHLGINGSRGSKQGHELAYGNAMVAHSHTPSVYHDTFTVGHMTIPRHGYNNGPSSWVLACGAVYQGSHKQLYMIIKGSAFRPRKKKATKK